MTYPVINSAAWPFTLGAGVARAEVDRLAREVDRLAAEAQYGWGHTIDFGPFERKGLLGDHYLRIAGAFDQWGWWPERMDGLCVADVGCFTGGLALLCADRGAKLVYAVDEIPEHVAQCELLSSVFHTPNVRPVVRSAYRLSEVIPAASLDVIVLSGVIYHLSDMLIGLYAMRELLAPDGLLLIQSNAIEDFEHSYANFGRFVAGRWWQPTALCLQDMLAFAGFRDAELRFYQPQSCLARAYRSEREIPFKRGLNWSFEDFRDSRPRSLDVSLMAPAPDQSKTVASGLMLRLRALGRRIQAKP